MPQFTVHELTAAVALIGKNSGLQFLGSFGILFISGLALSFISKWTSNAFQQFRFPKVGLYVFGIIGVPLHEFCHALFAKIFFHEVKSIKWFDPKGQGGALGSVTHHYEERNLYHRIGLFFIGMGPVLLAPFLLLGAYYFLVPSSSEFAVYFSKPQTLIEAFLRSLLVKSNWGSIGFYFFIYFAVCLTSQMELSSADLKIAKGGSLPFFALLFLLNAAAYLFKWNLHGWLSSGFKTIVLLWGACFVTALMIAILNLFACSVLLNVFNRLLGAGAVNPFRNPEEKDL